MTEEERDAIRYKLRVAGIPPRLWKASSKDYKRQASDLFTYIESSLYADDLNSFRGLCLSGNAALRSDLLAMLAKTQAVAGASVQFITIHALLHFIEHDAERRTELSKVKYLYIDGFEKEFTKDYDCPYTFYQQVEVEEFLKSRVDASNVNNFATAHRWPDVKWWSRDFIAGNAAHVRDIVI